MNTYEEIYSTLLKLCKKEGLRLIEAELRNEKIKFVRKVGKVILNRNYHEFKN